MNHPAIPSAVSRVSSALARLAPALLLLLTLAGCASSLPSATPRPAPTALPTARQTSTTAPTRTPTGPARLPDEDPVYLADLQPEKPLPGLIPGVFTAASELFHQGDPLVYKGQAYPKGLYTPAVTELDYATAAYDTFKTDLFVAGPGPCRGDGVIVRLELNGEPAYVSPWVFSGQPPLHIELDVSHAAQLKILVGGGTGGDTSCDYAVLGDPYFTRKVDSGGQTAAMPGGQTAAGSAKPVSEFFVAPGGDDHHPGTLEQPFATLQRARDAVRAIPADRRGPVTVTLRGGEYFMAQPLILQARDSGQPGAPVTYRAYPGETPVLSGGRAVGGWRPVAGSPIWQAPLADPYIRQVFVNGRRASLARLSGTFTPLEFVKGAQHPDDGLLLQPDAIFDRLLDARHLVFRWVQEWKDLEMLVDHIEKRADGSYVAWMLQPDWNAMFAMRSPDQTTYPQPGRPFTIENAYELIDQPGEYYADVDQKMLYYLPRPGEDMTTAAVVVPAREELLRIQGYNIGEEVHDLNFEGLTFAFAGWNYAALRSRFGWQAENILVSERPRSGTNAPAAVRVTAARAIHFDDDRWQHLGDLGLFLTNNVTRSSITGSIFDDLGDASILIGREIDEHNGDPQGADCSQVEISNNLIHNTGNDNYGATALNVQFGSQITIAHNEINYFPYTGISLMTGWWEYGYSTFLKDNQVLANRVDQGMLIARDGGGIYTMGPQGGTRIAGNYLSNQKNWTGGIYLDGGSTHVTIEDNVIENTVFWINHNGPTVHDNTVRGNFSNTPNLNDSSFNLSQVENNTIATSGEWPDAARKIMAQAGLWPAYQGLRSQVKIEPGQPFPMPQDGTVYLGGYPTWYVANGPFYDFRVGAFPFDSDIFKRDEPLRYQGKDYPHGIFAYPLSYITYFIGGNYQSFDADFFVVGPSPACKDGDGAFPAVELDEQGTYAGPKRINGAPPIHIHLDVTGKTLIKLGVYPGDNPRCDYAVWGDPRVSRKP